MSLRSKRLTTAFWLVSLSLLALAVYALFLLDNDTEEADGSMKECVVLIHGLARTSRSLKLLEKAITNQGFYVTNIDYPSRDKPIKELAEIAVGNGLTQCEQANATPVNFVTHSLGGILVRQYFKLHAPDGVHRVVMLGPPNKGSEVVDKLKDMPGYELINGPAGMQLGTGNEEIPKSLGPVNFELGVIAGTKSINWILSLLLPEDNDGKVSVESAQVEGMCSFLALPTTHPFMMNNEDVIFEVIHFLKYGKFKRESASVTC